MATAENEGVEAVNELLNWSLAQMENRVIEPAVDNVSMLPNTTDFVAHAKAVTTRVGMGEERMGLNMRETDTAKVPDTVAVKALANLPSFK